MCRLCFELAVEVRTGSHTVPPVNPYFLRPNGEATSMFEFLFKWGYKKSNIGQAPVFDTLHWLSSNENHFVMFCHLHDGIIEFYFAWAIPLKRLCQKSLVLLQRIKKSVSLILMSNNHLLQGIIILIILYCKDCNVIPVFSGRVFKAVD